MAFHPPFCEKARCSKCQKRLTPRTTSSANGMCTCTPLVPTRFFQKEEEMLMSRDSLVFCSQEEKKNLRVLQEHTKKKRERERDRRQEVSGKETEEMSECVEV